MYKKILAAVNEHINSEVAARYALRLAKSCGAKFITCFVAEKGTQKESIMLAEEAMKRLLAEAEDLQVEAESVMRTGETVKEISALVRHKGIDIVFAATRRSDIERRFYSGTVARRLSLELPCSAALVRVVHMGRIQPQKILVPQRGRFDHIEEMAYFTAKMAECCNAKVVVFHAIKPIKRFFSGEIHLTPFEWEKRFPEAVSEFMEHLRKYEIELEGRLLPGKTARGITIEAAAKRHDLIIMGASERSLLATVIKGNPVEEVLRETPCDLIILKPRHED